MGKEALMRGKRRAREGDEEMRTSADDDSVGLSGGTDDGSAT
jgi:hypothetical protein